MRKPPSRPALKGGWLSALLEQKAQRRARQTARVVRVVSDPNWKGPALLGLVSSDKKVAREARVLRKRLRGRLKPGRPMMYSPLFARWVVDATRDGRALLESRGERPTNAAGLCAWALETSRELGIPASEPAVRREAEAFAKRLSYFVKILKKAT